MAGSCCRMGVHCNDGVRFIGLPHQMLVLLLQRSDKDVAHVVETLCAMRLYTV